MNMSQEVCPPATGSHHCENATRKNCTVVNFPVAKEEVKGSIL
jgi:hypothetical protein